MDERRQVPRYLADLPVRITRLSSGDVFLGKALVLAVRGCAVEGAGPLSAGEKCRVSIDWEGRAIRADAEVAWKNARGQAGLRFTSIAPECTDVLRELLPNLRLQPLVHREES